MKQLRPLLVFGTRPEAIKMAPVIHECQRRSNEFSPIVCSTGQHREMLSQVTEYFGIRPDIHLELMQPNQTLSGLTARCLEGIDSVLKQFKPDCIVGQGDTTTVMAAALAAFYHRVPFVHVEAGLRTGDLSKPWPEEMNRRFAGMVASLHCAPTKRAADALLAEGVPQDRVHITGNTVIDALLQTLARERENHEFWDTKYKFLSDSRVVLVTGHRRENFGGGFENICGAIAQLAKRFSDCSFVYPVHLNPNVLEPVRRLLGGLRNVYLVEPVPYPEFVWLMDRATIILTDSGGVQEEAPSLRRPVLVMRESTERPEALESGAAILVGTSVTGIESAATNLLSDAEAYRQALATSNPYGDGQAASRIVELMRGISSF
jgi:UDP-N-acetylglucosamine 2-epimerase (non-hydrolysing)